MMDIEQPAPDHSSSIARGGGSGILSAEASRLFRVYKTIGAMLSKRGYMVSREMREMSPLEFTHKFGEFPSREGLTILVVRDPFYTCLIWISSVSWSICQLIISPHIIIVDK